MLDCPKKNILPDSGGGAAAPPAYTPSRTVLTGQLLNEMRKPTTSAAKKLLASGGPLDLTIEF